MKRKRNKNCLQIKQKNTIQKPYHTLLTHTQNKTLKRKFYNLSLSETHLLRKKSIPNLIYIKEFFGFFPLILLFVLLSLIQLLLPFLLQIYVVLVFFFLFVFVFIRIKNAFHIIVWAHKWWYFKYISILLIDNNFTHEHEQQAEQQQKCRINLTRIVKTIFAHKKRS